MPQFNLHTPKTQSDMFAMRKNKVTLPTGVIGQNNDFSNGYDGDKYYVTECSILDYYVTKTYLSFDEAKQLFNALTFVGKPAPKPSKITSLVKFARKQKLSGDELFWHFEQGI